MDKGTTALAAFIEIEGLGCWKTGVHDAPQKKVGVHGAPTKEISTLVTMTPQNKTPPKPC